MRDYLCNENKCREQIDIYIEAIQENKEEIESIAKDNERGIQEQENDTAEVIFCIYTVKVRYDRRFKNTFFFN